ncbi:L,D-transpeptidase family protein [Qipengyuania zhejiangensis]|uniref:L,D-transpeptidase family protein n=1 Tax=Qipengyuania zhejiangensis TaxID=3077782 RepID=UPI002D79DC99|nr:L,D-transpeptidase family protein [Qipengyuania sp. Z2]
MRNFIATVSLLALAACGMSGQDNDAAETNIAATADSGSEYGYETYGDDNLADTMASNDAAYGKGDAMPGSADTIADPEDRPVMQAQVVLDRRGFGPGVIDGKMGLSTENALRGFQEANKLEITGKLDTKTRSALEQWRDIPATRVVTIPASWSTETFYEMPDSPADQAKMKRLGYTSLDEKLAERFHTTVDVLKQLNPGGVPAGMKGGASTTGPAKRATASATPTPAKSGAAQNAEDGFTPTPNNDSFFTAGRQIRVPNIGADRIAPGKVEKGDWQKTLASLGVGTEQAEVTRIVVSEKAGTLKAFDADDKLVAMFTVTTGSKNDPLPIGEWKILGVARNTPFAYNPELFWDVSDDEEKQMLPPGPNGPVGVVWIDLSKEHYGIHGTPEPETIGRTQSHGCVRLTNWDAARLSQMVSTDTQVIFEA